MNTFLKNCILLLMLFASVKTFAQTADTSLPVFGDTLKPANLDVDGGAPHFNGDLVRYLTKTIEYPHNELEAHIMGRVVVSFIVETDGSITNVKVEKGVPNGPGLEAEAVRVVKSMPKWVPAMQNGKPIRSKFLFPVNFKLR